MKKINCFACGSSRSKLFFKENNYTYVKCKDCGLIYIDHEIKQNFEDISKLSINELIKFEDERKYLFNKEINSIKKIKNSGCVLDIGCSGGLAPDLLRKKGYEILGIEPDKNMVICSKKLRKIPIFNGTLEEFKSGKKFDIITLWDVLEHVPRPDKELDLVEKYLKKDGILFLRVPTAGYVTFKIRLIKMFGLKIKNCLDPPVHIFFQSKKSLENLLKNHGFKIMKIETSRSVIPSETSLKIMKGILYHFARIIYFLSFKKLNFVINYTVYAKKCK